MQFGSLLTLVVLLSHLRHELLNSINTSSHFIDAHLLEDLQHALYTNARHLLHSSSVEVRKQNLVTRNFTHSSQSTHPNSKSKDNSDPDQQNPAPGVVNVIPDSGEGNPTPNQSTQSGQLKNDKNDKEMNDQSHLISTGVDQSNSESNDHNKSSKSNDKSDKSSNVDESNKSNKSNDQNVDNVKNDDKDQNKDNQNDNNKSSNQQQQQQQQQFKQEQNQHSQDTLSSQSSSSQSKSAPDLNVPPHQEYKFKESNYLLIINLFK